MTGSPLGASWLVARDLARRLDWRAEVLALLLVAAESALVYLFLGVLLRASTPSQAPLPGLLIFALLALGYWLPHLLDELRVWTPDYEVALGVGIVLSLLVSVKVAAFPRHGWLSLAWLEQAAEGLIVRPSDAVRPVWGVVGLVAYAWWRGRTRAEPTIDAAFQMLRWGTLVAAAGLLFVVVGAPERAPIRERTSLAIVLYFAAALGAVGVARLRVEGLRTGGPLGPHWLAGFAIPIASVVAASVALAGLFSPRALQTLLLLLTPVFWLLDLAARALVFVVALMAFVVISPILWLLERQGLTRLQGSRIPQLLRSVSDVHSATERSLEIADPVRYLIAGVVLALLGSTLIRFAYRRRRHWRDTAQERRESVFAWDDAVGGVAEGLRRLLRRPRRRGDPLAALRGDPRWAHTVFIRETYIRLLERAAAAGVARAPDMTPDEFARALAGRFPGAGEAIRTITRAYDAARYSPEPASAEAARAVREAWAALSRQPTGA